MRIHSKLLCLVLSWLSVFPILARGEPAQLEQANRYAISRHRPAESAVGVCVFDLTRGEEVYALQADEPFTTASNTKLFTTAAALELLRSGFRFRTELFRTGEIGPQGVLKGHLLIRGGGDPNLSGRFHEGRETWIMESWAEKLMQEGVQRIAGDIVADDLYFDRQHLHPSWPKGQLAFWYCAPVSGLSFNDNCIRITVTPTRPGQPPNCRLSPATSYVKLVNQCKTVTKATRPLVFHRPEHLNTIYVKGHIQGNAKPWVEWITVREPALFFATVFREVLARKGIPVDGRVRLIKQGEMAGAVYTHVARYTSDLVRTIAVANKRSQNFYAEQIFKTLGRVVQGQGSFEGGRRAIARFMRDLGFEQGSYQIVDGSGLAKGNRFSPRQVVAVLRHMHHGPSREKFVSSLAVAGVDGSMAGRLTEAPYRGRVFAKTGYVSGASALSGYVQGAGGWMFAFSILVNRLEPGSSGQAKRMQEEVCKVLVAHGRSREDR